MNRKIFKGITFVILVSVALAACSESHPAEPPAPVIQTVIVTREVQVIVTPTPAAPAPSVDQPVAAPVMPQVSTQSNGWKITWMPGASLDRGDGTTFKQDAQKWDWKKVAPELWPTYPNVPNPLVPEFRVVTCPDDPAKQCVPDGMEYAMMETNFCQQLAGEACRVPVAAEHFLYFSGDYNFPGIGSCSEGGTRIGCMLVIVNVGKVTADFSPVLAQGFRLHARYFNGNALDMGVWGLVSNGANSMMNMGSTLNPPGLQNAGANCSVPEGCKGVNIRVMFTSGNEYLELLETTVTR